MGTQLQGRIAVVTAAAQGIGRATALACAREGARVLATDINLERLRELDGTAGIETAALDVTDAAAVAAFAARIPVPDLLVNCAGFVHHGTVLECTPEQWDFAFRLNAGGMFQMIRALLPRMLDNGGGSIVNIASVAGSIRGIPNRFAYGASKAAVIGLTKSVAIDFVKRGIRCNAICPGTVDTPSLGDRINAFADPEQARRDFIARQPMGRLGTAGEIAELVVYLGTDASAFMTGQTVIIDGGVSL